MEEKQRVDEPLPWDRPKPHPDDGDLFGQDRLTLARLAVRPILEDPPPARKE